MPSSFALPKTPRFEQFLTECRRHVYAEGETIKFAELGGDGQDVPFEQAFSNLAHAYLRDKAPTLLDHEMGFQLLDRNQENTKAIGIFAFKVGSQLIYAPVFFLSGDLKGHELLYLKEQDMFVPLKENWINYILNRKPNILGSGTPRQTSSIGVLQPELNRLSESPSKFAASVRPYIRPFLPKFAAMVQHGLGNAIDDYARHCQERLDLSHFVKQAGIPMLDQLVDLLGRKPKLAKAYDEWHGLDALADVIKEARVRYADEPRFAPRPTAARFRVDPAIDALFDKSAADDDDGPEAKNKIEVITEGAMRTSEAPIDMDEEEAEQLLQDGVLIRDHREGEEVSVAYKTDVERRLTNPTETGVYAVLTKSGEFEDCLVVVNPHGPDGRKNFCVVVRLDGEKRNWCNVHRHKVWIAGETGEGVSADKKWKDFFDDQSEAKELPERETWDTRFLLIGPKRNATVAFNVERGLGDKTWEIDPDDYCRDYYDPVQAIGRPHGNGGMEFFDEYEKYRDGARVILDSKEGTELRSNSGNIYVPSGYKLLRLKPKKSDEDRNNEDGPVKCCLPGDSDSSDPPAIRLGNLVDAEMSIRSKTAELRISCDAHQFSVNRQPGVCRRDAIVHLVRDHGLRKEAAAIMLDQARADHIAMRGAAVYRVKYANPFLTQGAPSAPAIPDVMTSSGPNMMGFSGPTMPSQDFAQSIPGMDAGSSDLHGYEVSTQMDPSMPGMTGMADQIQQAANTGQREVFDTAMIGSMLRAVRDDTMIDRYIPDLVSGMDKLGRLLFMFYWHQDKWAERYGKQDLPELEDSLRNAFEMIGDVILFLKQKTIEPYPEEAARDLDLGDAATI